MCVLLKRWDLRRFLFHNLSGLDNMWSFPFLKVAIHVVRNAVVFPDYDSCYIGSEIRTMCFKFGGKYVQ